MAGVATAVGSMADPEGLAVTAGRWEMTAAWRAEEEEVEALLVDGWEPFAADETLYHFRRWVPTPPARGKVVDAARCQCGALLLDPDVLETWTGRDGHHARSPEPCGR